MQVPYFQVDAFTTQPTHGNSAGICPLSAWLSDAVLQAIAAENNLAETAYFLGSAGNYHLRWFTPATEVDLCGHATLAAAFVIFREYEPQQTQLRFETRSGVLTVHRQGDWLTMDFPARPASECDPPGELLAAMNLAPQAVLRSRDYLLIYQSEDEVAQLAPQMGLLEQVETLGVIATAEGRAPEVDFVSRFFAPRAGVPEDPVTGSAHCTLTPYWAERLGKTKLSARQISRRAGRLECELLGDRVAISGQAVLFLQGTIFLPDEGVSAC